MIRAGAAGVAVISAICAADDPRGAAKALIGGDGRSLARTAAGKGEGERMIAVTVNGKPREIEDEIDLAGLLQSLEVDARGVAVARNGEVVPRDRRTRR